MAFKSDVDTGIGCFGAIVLIVVLIFLAPFLGFCEGWLIGWIIKVTFGDTLLRGLAMLGIGISKDAIPLFCGTLEVIGSFFKTPIVRTKKD